MADLHLKDSYYFYLDSISFTQRYHSNNNALDFTSEVLDPVFLNSTEYEIALTEITWISPKGPNFENFKTLSYNVEPNPPIPDYEMYVLCDIVTPDIQVGARLLPLLRIVREPTVFQNLYYVNLSVDFIQRIRIYLRTVDNSTPDFKIGGLRCGLHIRKKNSE